jgi:hypothetical protein
MSKNLATNVPLKNRGKYVSVPNRLKPRESKLKVS